MGMYYLGNEVTIFETFTIEGVPTDPTTVTFTVELPDQTTEVFVNGVDPEVTNPSVGYYELAYTPATVGVYQYNVVGAGAVIAASPPGSFTVLADAITTAQAGPCEPWISADDVAECCSVETTSTFLFDSAAYQAQQLLFELSGRQFAGVCSRTVRPACDSCWCGYQVLSRGHVIGPADYGYPLMLCDSCLIACSPSRIKLAGYPVRAISQVKIDGAVVPTTDYTIWNQRYLTRLNDAHWPVAQDLTLADTEDSTFSITYLYGAQPPEIGRSAAAQLGCELYKACAAATSGDCALPAGTTRVTQQGIVIEKIAFTSWAYRDMSWRTGLPLVDAFLNTYNPTGLKRRPVFWAPGKHQYAQSFG